MDKNTAINQILNQIYSSKTCLILSEKEIACVNTYYKNKFNKVKSYVEFLYGSPEITGLIAKMQSGRFEIEKQFHSQKALQPAILTECVYSQTLASIFKLTECIDLDETAFNKIPIECLDFIKTSKNTISAARYIYYSKKDKSKFLIQYGNPSAGDAGIVFFTNDIKLEFKESNAKAGEYDLTVNEDGKLLPSEKIKNEFPFMQKFINDFNSRTSLFNHLGSNYKIEKTDDFNPMTIAVNYFTNNGIDLLITSINNEIVGIKPSDLTSVLDDHTVVATTEGSEIRTTGKNHMELKLEKYFKETVGQIATTIDGKMFSIKKSDINTIPGYKYIKGRGTSEIGRLKLNYMFFVPVQNVIEDEDTVSFSIENVRQTKPTISVHIKVTTDKKHLQTLYY